MNAKEARELNSDDIIEENPEQIYKVGQANGYLICYEQMKLVEALADIVGVERANKFAYFDLDGWLERAEKTLSQFRKAQGEE